MKRTATIWAGRFLWGTLMLMIAVGAISLQLDFVTRTRPALAPVVPEPFRSFANAPLAATALQAEHGQKAYQYAALLVQRRPIPADSLSLFALAAQTQAETDLSSQALTAAAKRGWRDPVSQSAVVYAAQSVGDWRVLAERLDALQRIGHPELAPPDVWSVLLGTSEGQQALAERLIQDRNWFGGFLRFGSQEIRPSMFGETVQKVIASGGEAECRDLSAAAVRLVREGEIIAAQQVWQGNCLTARAEMKPGFRPTANDDYAGPFEWSYPRQAGLQRSFRESDSGWVLDYRHQDNLRGILATRILTLAPGEHSFQLSRQSGAGGEAFLRLRCLGERSRGLLQDEPIASELEFSIPSDCPVQQLSIVVGQGQGEGVKTVLE